MLHAEISTLICYSHCEISDLFVRLLSILREEISKSIFLFNSKIVFDNIFLSELSQHLCSERIFTDAQKLVQSVLIIEFWIGCVGVLHMASLHYWLTLMA